MGSDAQKNQIIHPKIQRVPSTSSMVVWIPLFMDLDAVLLFLRFQSLSIRPLIQYAILFLLGISR